MAKLFCSIWLFSKNLLLIVFVTSLCLVTFGMYIYMTIQIMRVLAISEFQSVATEVAVVFSFSAASESNSDLKFVTAVVMFLLFKR